MEQEERLRDWMEKYTNRLYRLAYTLTHSKAEADDRVQDGSSKHIMRWGRLISCEILFLGWRRSS